jgi:hypothetical protein
MVKACSKFGGRRASVRDTRLNKVVARKKGNWRNKNKEQKRSAFSFYFFFGKNVYTSTRTLDPSHKAPGITLWTTERTRFPLSCRYRV